MKQQPKLKAQFSQYFNAQLLPLTVLQTLQTNKILIDSKTYNTENWGKIFQEMVQCSIFQLTVTGNIYKHNVRPTILKQISNINFLQLAKLMLSSNLISNIQPISWMNAPKLARIHLSNNLIVKINCFSKVKFTNLRQIIVSCNFINHFSTLTQTNLNQGKIQAFVLQYDKGQTPNGYDLTFLIKIQIKNIRSIFRNSFRRINQTKLQIMLAKKYSQLRLISR